LFISLSYTMHSGPANSATQRKSKWPIEGFDWIPVKHTRTRSRNRDCPR
jgi:hypothetical protein